MGMNLIQKSSQLLNKLGVLLKLLTFTELARLLFDDLVAHFFICWNYMHLSDIEAIFINVAN